jgi:hypothetical protein
MELINATRMSAGYTMGLEPSGRELLVVVIKGSFVIPRPGEKVRLADEQRPLVMADTFTGEPGFSAPVLEVDYAPRKHACDVLLTGSVRAPEGRMATRLQASLRVGAMHKRLDVFGDRVWEAGLGGIKASPARAFEAMPVSYDRAFGGADRHPPDEAEHDAYLANPVGRGWHKYLKSEWVDGSPLPNVERPGENVTAPDGRYTPIALGPLGRGWPQRARFAGTYDDAWLADVFPFLPKDFDERYYQAAPQDQQLPFPREPLEVVMQGFFADGPRQFVLPYFEAPVVVFPKRGEKEDYTAALDTIVFDTDAETVTMSWRVARPLKKSMHELAQVLVGRKGKDWWQQREQVAFPIPVVMVPTERAPAEASAGT